MGKKKAKRSSKPQKRNDEHDGSPTTSPDNEQQEQQTTESSVPAMNKTGKKGHHQSQLESLKEKDPEFFAYLQETDADLLHFNESDDEGDQLSDSEQGSENGDSGPSGNEKKQKAKQETHNNNEEDLWPASASEDEEEEKDDDVPDQIDEQKYLQDSDDEEEQEEDEEGEGKSSKQDKAKEEQGSAVELTSSMLVPKLKQAFSHLKLSAFHDVLHAFKSACKSSITEETSEENTKYKILSETVFNRVVVTVLTNARSAFVHHLKDKRGKVGKTGFFTEKQLRQCKNWKRISPLIQSFLVNIGRLLPEVRNPQMLLFILRSLRHYIPFFGVFPKLSRKLVKSLLNFWGKAHTYVSDEDAEVGIATGKVKKKKTKAVWSTNVAQQVMNAAFLRIRQCALELPYPTIDACLKGVYLGYVRSSKFVNESNRFWLTQMGNAVVEIFGLDSSASYQHAFVYIRQLALSLRSALAAKTEDAVRNVASWQFVNCCKVWVAIMTAYTQDSEHPLFTLIYPLVQIILGSLRVASTPRYWYMRLHLISLLNDMQWATGVYIPVAIPLLDILRSAPLQRKPSNNTIAKPPSFEVTLKISDAAISSRVVQNFVVEKSIALLGDHLKANSASVGFPELALPVQLGLRAFAKKTKISTWRHCARDLVDWSVKHASKVAKARSESNLSPSNVAEIRTFQESAKGQEGTPYPAVTKTIGVEYQKLRQSRLRLSHASTSSDSIKTAGKKRPHSDAQDEEHIEEQQKDTLVKTKSSKKKRKKSKGPKPGKEALNQEDVVNPISAADL